MRYWLGTRACTILLFVTDSLEANVVVSDSGRDFKFSEGELGKQCVCLCVSVCVCVHVCMSVFLYVYVFVFRCMFMCMDVYICMYLSICVFKGVFAYVHVYVCMSVYMYMMSISVYECIYMYALKCL